MLKAKEVELSYKRDRKLDREKLQSSEDVFHFALKFYDDNVIDYKEYCYVILMNNSLRPNGWHKVSEGGLTETIVDIKIVLQAALLSNSACIILVHNHPSGNVRPSKFDDKLTERLKNACEIMSIKFQDHVIVTSEAYYSYNDEGRL